MTAQAVELPLPRENFDGMIVVASVWLDDRGSAGNGTALLLTLASSEPYYRLREIVLREDGSWRTVFFDDYPNIVLAVEAYKDAGGDY